MKRLRLGLFLALCAVQLAIHLAMAYRYERTLREGTVYRFHTEPFDPVDAFRGRYVAIQLRLECEKQQDVEAGMPVFAVLRVDEQGYAAVGRLEREPPLRGDWISGTYFEMWRESLPADRKKAAQSWDGRIELPFDRYYMEEGKAPRAERATQGFFITRSGPQMDVTARVRVRHGLGAIEGLDINGVPIERWLATVPP
ncbi:MAG TPA: GDYXXLXY domain-containing protein [Candidatus Polarisedimenticolaceae bacterium]|nr:GDYXXLXY domain-containing protein [Candidatus Polarisedimenticolaceae bacterium]